MISFEALHKDIWARTGRLKVGEKIARTPLLLPVINPHIQLITPQEMQEMGVEALITNAYIFSKSSEFREEALSRGLHAVLGFDGIIMTDSGAFQQSVYGDVAFSNKETVQFQRAIGSEIIVPMDIATPPDRDYEGAREELSITMNRITEAMTIIDDGHLAAPVQGGIFPDVREDAAARVNETSANFCPIGAVVPLMENYRYKELVQVVLAVKRRLNPSSCVHLFGAGHPAMFALAAAMGCDVFDSAAYALYAREGRYMTTSGSLKLNELQELPCACQVCRTHTAEELKKSPDKERLLAMHNLAVSLAEISRIRQAIIDGTLWEVVDERCRSHPRLLEGYRELLTHSEELARRDNVSKRRFFYRGEESCSRTEVIRHQSACLRFRPGTTCHITMNEMVPENAETVFQFKPPFGIYPPEMAETFPIGQSEIPGWDEAMMKAGLAGVRKYMEYYPATQFTISCPERWITTLQRSLEGLEDKYVCI